MKVLIVLTSHSELGNTGKKTGFWIEEFAAPYYALVEAGISVVLASPNKGSPFPSTQKVMSHQAKRQQQSVSKPMAIYKHFCLIPKN